MRILAIADEESRMYFDFYHPGCLDEFDLILACGDLHREYLEFLVTMAHCPLVYVRGNHDDSYDKRPPEGCICIEDDIFVYKGIRILGLGGSYAYRNGLNMYTDQQMNKRIRKLWFKLFRHKGFDILLTHAPALHLNDMNNLTHRGFEGFRTLLDRYEPKYFIHGHIHRSYGVKIPQKCFYKNTTVINAYEYFKFDYETGK